METTWLRRALLALCLAVPLTAGAETINPIDRKLDVCGRYEVFHINGINTDPFGAQFNLVRLAAAYGNAHEGHLINYFLAHNRSKGFMGDVQQTWLQILRDFPSLSWGIVLAVINGFDRPEMTPELMAEIRARFDRLNLMVPDASGADLLYMQGQVQAQHQTGSKVLFVAHSQGTLFANDLYDALSSGSEYTIPAASMGIVSVANVTTGVRGAFSRYVTNRKDLPVNGLRVFVSPEILPWNVDLPFTLSDPAGHNFVAVYLAFARATIVASMQQALSQVAGTPNPMNLPVGGSLNDYRLYGWGGYLDCSIGPNRHQSCPAIDTGFDMPLVRGGTAVTRPEWRPGSFDETDALANAHADSCLGYADLSWQYHRTPSFTPRIYGYYCGQDGSSSELSLIFMVLRSADSLERVTVSSFSTTTGATGVTIRGMCRTPSA
jgi:hypothetical protein